MGFSRDGREFGIGQPGVFHGGYFGRAIAAYCKVLLKSTDKAPPSLISYAHTPMHTWRCVSSVNRERRSYVYVDGR